MRDEALLRIVVLKVETAGIELARTLQAADKSKDLENKQLREEVDRLRGELSRLQYSQGGSASGGSSSGGQGAQSAVAQSVLAQSAVAQSLLAQAKPKTPSLWKDTEKEKERLYAVLLKDK